jgi:hypothetical protein
VGTQIKAPALRKVVEWCVHHQNDGAKTTKLGDWDREFLQVDNKLLGEIILVCQPPLPFSSRGVF